MRVGIMVIEIVAHLLDYITRHLSTARAVKVSDREAIVYPLESRKV
jgi:hypothetical protein